MHKEQKSFDKFKDAIRTHKPFVFFVCFVFIFILYTNDRFRTTFTSVAQICTGIGAIVALFANVRQIDRQNTLEEEKINVKWRRRIFVTIINEYFYNKNIKKLPSLLEEVAEKHNISIKSIKKMQSVYKEIEKQDFSVFELSNNIYHGQYDDELEECFL